MSITLLTSGEALFGVVQSATALCLLLWACSFIIKNAKRERP